MGRPQPRGGRRLVFYLGKGEGEGGLQARLKPGCSGWGDWIGPCNEADKWVAWQWLQKQGCKLYLRWAETPHAVQVETKGIRAADYAFNVRNRLGGVMGGDRCHDCTRRPSPEWGGRGVDGAAEP